MKTKIFSFHFGQFIVLWFCRSHRALFFFIFFAVHDCIFRSFSPGRPEWMEGEQRDGRRCAKCIVESLTVAMSHAFYILYGLRTRNYKFINNSTMKWFKWNLQRNLMSAGAQWQLPRLGHWINGMHEKVTSILSRFFSLFSFVFFFFLAVSSLSGCADHIKISGRTMFDHWTDGWAHICIKQAMGWQLSSHCDY